MLFSSLVLALTARKKGGGGKAGGKGEREGMNWRGASV